MSRKEWIEENEREMENYGKSMLSHSDDDYDSMKDYESCISHFQD